MYIKFKGQEKYHYCEEHLRELGEVDEEETIMDMDVIEDTATSVPKGKVCKECNRRAAAGSCTPPYAK